MLNVQMLNVQMLNVPMLNVPESRWRYSEFRMFRECKSGAKDIN